jgi:hypothetical protein
VLLLTKFALRFSVFVHLSYAVCTQCVTHIHSGVVAWLYVLTHFVSETADFDGITPLKTKRKTILFKDPACTAKYTLFFSVIKTGQFMLYREIVAICSEINTKHVHSV